MSSPPRPARGRAPSSTYRLQLNADFTLDAAIEVLAHLAELGVGAIYLSPLLAAVPGSTHGYDVVDPGRIDEERGGEAALRRLSTAAHAHGQQVVLDIVPNHLSVQIPRANAAWWDVLTYGAASSYARWFDVDWDAGALLLPVLGADTDLTHLQVVAGPGGPELAYYEHRFPVAPGTEGGTGQDVHERQHYRLVGWRHAATDLTYRRFFDVTTLAGLRVEDEAVYAATHRKILELVRDGVIDALRIDHPDGLADPAGYLDRLARDTGAVWTLVEKILESGETLPPCWATAGTTGYDAARLATGLFVDPAGQEPLTQLWQRLTGDHSTFAQKVLAGKRAVLAGPLAAELARLGRMAAEIDPQVIAAVLIHFPVYRSYLPGAGSAALAKALAGAGRELRADLQADLRLLAARLSDASDPLCIRFQQTSGMVMAKGVEDTAFYRHHVLLALAEVGSDPGHFGVGAGEWHASCLALAEHWPETMTLLSTHDTKRSEDIRARLVLLSELPAEWSEVVGELELAAAPYAGPVAAEDRYLLHQTLAGTGLIDANRVGGYLEKATREAKRHTSWITPDEAYDRQLQSLVRGVLGDDAYRRILGGLLRRLDPPWHRTVLAQKLAQLTMPGVPDLYQGSERELISLVDPDNRRRVDFTAPATVKTGLVKTVLHLRRDRPELFDGYRAVSCGSGRAVAYARSPDLLVVLATRAVALERDGWGTECFALPAGSWTDALSGRPADSGRLADVVGDGPGALLVRG